MALKSVSGHHLLEHRALGILVAQGALPAITLECAEMVACGRVEDDVQRLHDAAAPHALQRRRRCRIRLSYHALLYQTAHKLTAGYLT
jgi:hypothetical protein